MLKKLMIGTALSAFALSGAFAQSNPSTDPPASSTQTQGSSSGGSSMSGSSSMDKSPSAATSTSSSPSSATTGQASSPSASSTATTSSASGSQQFVASQQSNQWLSSKFIGTDVVGADDKKIGDVSDVLFDQQGKVEAYVVGVGGFLGIGSKDVALAPSAFQHVKDNNTEKLKISMTKDQLEKAPAFERKQEPRATTTGTGSPSGGMGSPRPSGAPAGTAR